MNASRLVNSISYFWLAPHFTAVCFDSHPFSLTHFLFRLPWQYYDCDRDSSVPIISSSGSTPLYFMAANGHISVICTLLLHRAYANHAI